MLYYELTVTTCLLKDVYFDQANEKIAKLINEAMYKDEELAKKHKENCFKGYVFDSLYPREDDKTYKKGRIYVFKIRTLDKSFSKKIKHLLQKTTTDTFKIIAIESNTQTKRHITEIYTVTPALATVDGSFWTKDNDLMLLQERMQTNLIRKYKQAYHEELNPTQSFIQMLEIKNRKPMAIKYKNIKLIGNKFKIIVNDDDISQKLAFTALGTGLLEKNATAGMGFCIAKWI